MYKPFFILMPLLLAILLLSTGVAHAFVYSDIQIMSNITQTHSQISVSSVEYIATFYNLSGNVLNISFPSAIENLKLVGGATKADILPFNACSTFSPNTHCTLVEVYGVQNGVPVSFTYNFNETYPVGSSYFNTTLYFLPPSSC